MGEDPDRKNGGSVVINMGAIKEPNLYQRSRKIEVRN